MKIGSWYAYLATGRAVTIMHYIFICSEFTLLIPLIDHLAKSKYKHLGFAFTPLEIVLARLIPMMMEYELNQYASIIIQVSCLGWLSLGDENCGTSQKLSVLLTNIFVLLLAYRFIRSDITIRVKYLYVLQYVPYYKMAMNTIVVTEIIMCIVYVGEIVLGKM